jgi:hypothetical protein
MRLVGQTPECARRGCRERVGTNKDGYNLTCDGHIREHEQSRDGNRQSWQDLVVVCPVETCAKGPGEECVTVKGRPMLSAHKLRAAMSAEALRLEGEKFA